MEQLFDIEPHGEADCEYPLTCEYLVDIATIGILESYSGKCIVGVKFIMMSVYGGVGCCFWGA